MWLKSCHQSHNWHFFQPLPVIFFSLTHLTILSQISYCPEPLENNFMPLHTSSYTPLVPLSVPCHILILYLNRQIAASSDYLCTSSSTASKQILHHSNIFYFPTLFLNTDIFSIITPSHCSLSFYFIRPENSNFEWCFYMINRWLLVIFLWNMFFIMISALLTKPQDAKSCKVLRVDFFF